MTKTIACLVAAILLAGQATHLLAADQPLELEWENLVPQGQGVGSLFGIFEHGEIAPRENDEALYSEVVTDYDGKTVRLPGYLVPLDLGLEGGKEFLLVPYFGACIHVPPPPPNQIVFLTTEEPYELEALFEPVMVTGTLEVVVMSTDLADAGYAMSASKIEGYDN